MLSAMWLSSENDPEMEIGNHDKAVANFEEMVTKWRREISAAGRTIDRTIRDIEREESKLKLEVKKSAKAGDIKTAKTSAKEIVHSRKHKYRLFVSKAQLNLVSLLLPQHLATYKMTGHITQSAQLRQAMNNLTRLPELNNVMTTMSQEMEKVGFIEEMNDMDDGLPEPIEMDDEVEEEVDKVLDELTPELE